MFLSSFGERFPSESSDDGIFCQFMPESFWEQCDQLFFANVRSFSGSHDHGHAMWCMSQNSRTGKIMNLYKRLPDSVVNRGLTFERQPSFWDTLAVCNGIAGPCKSIIFGQCNGLAGYSLYLKYNPVSVYQTCPLSLSNWSQNYVSIN